MSELPRNQEYLSSVFRAAYPKVTAVLVRVLGDIDRAEEMTQEAIVKALQTWPNQGLPDDPVAWLITAGRNKAFDVFRHEKHRRNYQSTLRVVSNHATEPDFTATSPIDDDLLRLIFTCCHPSLSDDAQVTLTLKTVLGFSVDDIARSFLVSPGTVDKRLTRAKQKIRQQSVPYEIPSDRDLPQRIEGVLDVIYLLFNKGYWAASDPSLYRSRVCDDAIRLARMMARLFRNNTEARSLLALMLLTSARSSARLDSDNALVPLKDQDRSLWDRSRIQEGRVLIDGVFLAKPPPGPYQLQAAISAIHCQAATHEDTDWEQIVALYSKLESLWPSPVVTLNKAAAVNQSGQSEQAMVLLETLKNHRQLQDYQPYHAVLAQVYRDLGQEQQAQEAQRKAVALSTNPTEKEFLSKQLGSFGH